MNTKFSAKTLLIAGLALIMAVGGALTSCSGSKEIQALPNHFELSERVLFKRKTSFSVEADGKSYGNVSEAVIPVPRTLLLLDNNGATTASASVAILSWGTEINVDDGSGHRIGTIKEEVISSMLKTWTTYRILDAAGNQIAESHKTEFIDTDITLNAPDGKVMATMHRGWFTKFGDSWTVDVKDPRIDPRLALMIAAFKTAADNDKKHSADNGKTGSRPGKS